MYTINYKGFYIHGYCDREECQVQIPNYEIFTVKSIHAAKLAITAHRNFERREFEKHYRSNPNR